mmetsp:Transcript_54327/g.96354  ORF Transcript_54327/g.96354 Transcript_54327/m.96354 type:complete len:363 (+) Transcript_54327:87-1175(+)
MADSAQPQLSALASQLLAAADGPEEELRNTAREVAKALAIAGKAAPAKSKRQDAKDAGGDKKRRKHSAAVCLGMMQGHAGTVASLAVLSPTRVASASYDKTIKIWDTAAKKCIATLEGHTNWVLSITTLSGNKIASASGDKTVKVWDVDKASCIHTFEGHSGTVSEVAALGETQLVSASYDNSIRVWDLESKRQVATLEGHTDPVLSVTALGTTQLASGSRDKSIKVWSVDDGKCLSTFEAHRDWVTHVVAMSRDWVTSVDRLASCSQDKTIKIFAGPNVESWRCILTFDTKGPVLCLAFLGPGRLASGSSDGALKFWDIDAEKCMATVQAHSNWVRCVAHLSAGQTASGSEGRAIKLWAAR